LLEVWTISFPEIGGVEGWFGIECPLINFPSLDSAGVKKFQNVDFSRSVPKKPSTAHPFENWYEAALSSVPVQDM
jgi:hypothetical protein